MSDATYRWWRLGRAAFYMASPGDPIRCAVSLAYVVTTCSLIRLTWLNVSRFMATSSHDSANDTDADKADWKQ